MRFCLIPETGGSNVRLLLEVPPPEMPAKILNSYFQICVKPDRIHNMPSVKPKTLHYIIMPVTSDNLWQTAIGSTEFSINSLLNSCCVFLPGIKIIGAAEIILCTCSADCRELAITIKKEFNLTLTPPTIIIYTPGKVNTYTFFLYKVFCF